MSDSKAVQFIQSIVNAPDRVPVVEIPIRIQSDSTRSDVMRGDSVVIENLPTRQAEEIAAGMGKEYSTRLVE